MDIFVIIIIIFALSRVVIRHKNPLKADLRKEIANKAQDIERNARDMVRQQEREEKKRTQEIERRYTTSSEMRSTKTEKEIQQELKRSEKVAKERQEEEIKRKIENEKKRVQEQYQRQIRDKKSQIERSRSGSSILERSMSNVAAESVDELALMQAAAENGMDTGMRNSSGQAALITDVYELMTTGYQVKLSYERDFLAEGIDMLNRIQAQP